MATPDSIVVTGLGMRTPIGNDAVQSAAAVRAGINRFALWEAAGVAFEEEAGVVASALPEGSIDSAWLEKAEGMLPAPLHEALWQAGLFDLAHIRAPGMSERAGAFVAVPYADRAGVDDKEYRSFVIDARQHCIAPARADSVEVVAHEHAAGLIAVERATRELREGKIAYGVVVGVDSMLHSRYLAALDGERRLKLPTRPDGLIPGEAAAVVVLELERHARARSATILGRLGDVAVEHETVPLGPDHPIRAAAASRAVAAALEASGGPGRVHRVVADLSGERWRSLEWALLETRCLGQMPAGWRLWHPADCLGDLGAASAVVHLGLCLRAFARGYGGQGGILVSAASSRGERAAVALFPSERGEA